MIQEEFTNLQNIIFPIDRGNKSVYEFLNDDIIGLYMNMFSKVPSLEKDIYNIQNIFNTILKTLEYYNKGKIASAYNEFNTMMNEYSDKFFYSYVEETDNIHGVWGAYARAQKYEPQKHGYSPLQMLHLPFILRHKASAGRFSISGFPCSYLSLQDVLAWLEIKSPCSFAVLRINVNSSQKDKYKLLRLDFRPHEYFRIDGYNNISQDETKDYMIKLCYNIPLIAASSFVCKNEAESFKEEYIIPQMIMTWIKEVNSNCIGIRYNSCIDNSNEYCCYGGNNIAIPIISPNKDGYCEVLQKIFDIQNAKVDVYDTNELEHLPCLIKSYIKHHIS